MMRAYYGDQISPHMVETPEGYLICRDVKIGRTGSMQYLGRELPDAFREGSDDLCTVKRLPDELFSKDTIASFEGKPVTNTHPADNINVQTVGFQGCGHIQNVHEDGKYLVADLYITDAALINEVKEGLKREVSCGYDCEWVKTSDHQYEQREIVGNHVAVVKSGRAGHKVSIQDSKPTKIGGKKMSKNILDHIFGLGFKKYAEDAEPEEVAAATKAMNDKKAKDDDDEVKEKVKAKDEETPEQQKKEDDPVAKLAAEVKELKEALMKMAERHEGKKAADAKSIMDELEKDIDKDDDKKKAADDDEDEEENPAVQDDDDEVKKAKDDDDDDDEEEEEEPEPDKKKAADSAIYRKLVADMKPIIMGIKDERDRTKAAKKFAKSVRDARSASCVGVYSQIIDNAQKAHKKAADSKQEMSSIERSAAAVAAINAYGQKQAKEYNKNV